MRKRVHTAEESPVQSKEQKQEKITESERSPERELTSGGPVQRVEKPQVVILVGIQGSGKSTFASRLTPEGWSIVSQDKNGQTRWNCEREAVALLRRGVSVVIDRCNFNEEQRSHWIDIAEKLNCIVGAVVFAISLRVCIDRVNKRVDHPTLPPGQRSVGIIRSTARLFRAPRKSEGLMWCRTVRNDAAIDRVLAEIVAGISPKT